MFFGHKSGTINACMIEPTNRLLEISQRYNSKFTFFVDSGMLVKGANVDSFKNDLDEVNKQIRNWDSQGHETGLHIHPHWEDTKWNNGWEFNLNRYKLSDFEAEEIFSLFNIS